MRIANKTTLRLDNTAADLGLFALKSADASRQAGLAPDIANALAQALAKAEQAAPADRLTMFSRFEGPLRMDESGTHPPVDHKH